MTQHVVREYSSYGVPVRVEESVQRAVLGTLLVKPAFVSVRIFLKSFGEKLDFLFEDEDETAVTVANAIKSIVDGKIKLCSETLLKVLKEKKPDYDWTSYIDMLIEESFVRKEEFYLALKILVGNAIINMQNCLIDELVAEARDTDPFMAFGLYRDINSSSEDIEALEDALDDYCDSERSCTKSILEMLNSPVLLYDVLVGNEFGKQKLS